MLNLNFNILDKSIVIIIFDVKMKGYSLYGNFYTRIQYRNDYTSNGMLARAFGPCIF